MAITMAPAECCVKVSRIDSVSAHIVRCDKQVRDIAHDKTGHRLAVPLPRAVVYR
jgi:hypothetical protein